MPDILSPLREVVQPGFEFSGCRPSVISTTSNSRPPAPALVDHEEDFFMDQDKDRKWMEE